MIAACAPPFYCGGGKQALNLATKLVEKGYQVTFITNNIDGSAPAEDVIHGVKVIRVPAGGRARVRLLFLLLTSMAHLIRYRRDIDIVHFPSGAFWYVVPTLLLANVLQKPTLLKLTALKVDDPITIYQRHFGPLLIAMLKSLTRIIAITEEFKQRCLDTDFANNQIALIPNGVDTAQYQPDRVPQRALRQHLALPLDVCIVLFVGGVHSSKGVDTLIHAWKNIQAQQPLALLLLIGPSSVGSSTDEALLSEIETLQAQGMHIQQLPVQANIEHYYQSADIFTLPSRSEGLPNVTLEAMASGLPVVVTDISGHQPLVTDGQNGLMVPVGDVQALGDGLLTLMCEPALAQRFGMRARETIMDQFSFEIVAQQYDTVYQELLR